MLNPVNKAICRTFLCALAFTSFAGAQIVERSRTLADLLQSHPCNSGLAGRHTIVTDCDAADDLGNGEGAFSCFARCDGVDTWAAVSIGGGAGGGGEATSVQGSATLPATCTELDLYQDTDSGGTEFYVCTATDTWTKAGVGTIGGTLGATDNGICRADGTGTVTAQGSPLTLSDVSGVTTTLATITPAATTGATVAGQALAITASPAVASTDTAGAAAGGAITLTAGAAARLTSGNANGGSVNIVPGAGIGTGTAGKLTLGVFDANFGQDVYTTRAYYQGGSTPAAANMVFDGSGMYLKGAYSIEWGSGLPDAYAYSGDAGLSRSAAGVVRATDGNPNNTRGLLGGGAAVASATALPVPTGRVFHVTGTTTITSITSTNFQSGVCVTLIFDDVLTFTDGSNLKLSGDFVTTADDTWSGCYDGTNWHEEGRSVN